MHRANPNARPLPAPSAAPSASGPLPPPLVLRHAEGGFSEIGTGSPREARLEFPCWKWITLSAMASRWSGSRRSFAARLSEIQLMAGEPRGSPRLPQRRGCATAPSTSLGGEADRLVSLWEARGPRPSPLPKESSSWSSNGRGIFCSCAKRFWSASRAPSRYESGRLAAFQGEAVALVQLRGHGAVVLRATGGS